MNRSRIELAVNALVVLGLGLLITLLVFSYAVPPADADDYDVVDYAAASASHEDCINVLDEVGPLLIDAAVLARDLDEALAKSEAKVRRQEATIARLRERLAR